MKMQISKYIDRLKFLGIVRLSSDWKEESGGYQNERFIEDIVCLVDGLPHRMRVRWYQKIFPNPELSYSIEEDELISNDEYEKIVHDAGGVLDTPEVLEGIRIRSQLSKEIDELTPECPKCATKMVQREGRRGDFWGCRMYPNCKGTRTWDKELASKLATLWNEMQKYQNL